MMIQRERYMLQPTSMPSNAIIEKDEFCSGTVTKAAAISAVLPLITKVTSTWPHMQERYATMYKDLKLPCNINNLNGL